MLIVCLAAATVLSSVGIGQALTTDQISQKCSPSVAVVLVGDGEGVVIKFAPAVVLAADGVLLVPYHVIKDAKEVQVRLKSGEIFDDVKVLGTDDRRDIAAIKIAATDLSVLAPVNYEDLKIGGPLFVFTHRAGALWSLSGGKITAVGLADEVAGAGQGFRVIQFDASPGAGVDGGVIFDAGGNPIGLITSEYTTPVKSGFAIPISNVKALGTAERSSSLRSGRALKMPTSEAAFSAAKNPSNDPKDLLLNSKTIYVETHTSFFKEQQLINELNKRKQVKEWGWVLTTGSWEARNRADMIIELDHQILSFDFTFTVRHRKTSILISAGKAVIADGASGAPKMVDKIIKSISDILSPAPVNQK